MNLQDKLIDIGINADTKKLELKLRAFASFAKHCEALADELDTIDNAWQCECGSIEYGINEICRNETNEIVGRTRICYGCQKEFKLPIDDDLPTRLEGSE